MNTTHDFDYFSDDYDYNHTANMSETFWYAYNHSNELSEIVNSDEFYYAKKPNDAQVFPIIMLSLTILSAILITISFIYMIWQKKYIQSVTYELLMHFFSFKFLLVFAICFESLASILNERGLLHISKSRFICSLTSYIPYALESCINFHLLLIWLILMSERNLAGLKFLYNDFRLRKALKVFKSTGMTDMEARAGTSNSASTQQNSQQSDDVKILELRFNSIKNFFLLNNRQVILCSFYIIVFALALHLSLNTYVLTFFYTGLRICYPTYGYFSKFLLILSLPFYFLPLLYMLLIVPTLFGKFFGGERDPLFAELSEEDKRHLKFIKIASFIKAIDEVLVHIHSSTYLYLDPFVYKTCRVLGLVFILAIVVLFLFEERACGYFVRKENLPAVSLQQASQRVSNIIFKGQTTASSNSAQSDDFDYKILIENENI